MHFGLCDRVLLQDKCGIGLADPLSIYIDSYETARNGKTDYDLMSIVMKNFKANFLPKHSNMCILEEWDFTWEQPKKDLTF